MSRLLVMKFMLQLHKLPTCPERKCGDRMGALENQAEQTWTSHNVALLMFDATCQKFNKRSRSNRFASREQC